MRIARRVVAAILVVGAAGWLAMVFWHARCPGLRELWVLATPVKKFAPPFPADWYVEDLSSSNRQLVVRILTMYCRGEVPDRGVPSVVHLARQGDGTTVRVNALAALFFTAEHSRRDWRRSRWLTELLNALSEDADPQVRSDAREMYRELGLEGLAGSGRP